MVEVKGGHKVKKVACGESHTIIVSKRAEDEVYSTKVTGANDKYQTGIQGSKRENIYREFTEIPGLKNKQINEIKCWNFSACIDDKKNLYVWGALVSNSNPLNDAKPSALCIK